MKWKFKLHQRVKATGRWSKWNNYNAHIIKRHRNGTYTVIFHGHVYPQIIPEFCLELDHLYYSPLAKALR